MRKEHTRSEDTAGRLLDAAEALFGELGYDGVGMRALAQHAHVNLAAATYHFGSKKGLYLETFLRRFRAVNAEQARLLSGARAQSQGRTPDVETIIECIMRPPFQTGLEHPSFSRLLARNMIDPLPFLEDVLRRELEANTASFIAALQDALPEFPAPLLRLRVALSMGPLLMLTAELGKAPGARGAARNEAVFKEVVRFAATGMASPPATSTSDTLLLPMMRRPRPRGRR
jgi:AcrR family transcriptional regulator